MSALQRALWAGSAGALAALIAATSDGLDLWMLAAALLLTGCLVTLAVRDVLACGLRQMQPVGVLATQRAVRQVEANTAALRETQAQMRDTRAEVGMMRDTLAAYCRVSGEPVPAELDATQPMLRAIGRG